jgi:hypothetical protein
MACAGLAATVAVASLLVAAGGAGAATGPSLNWQPCASAPGFQCADLTLPLDYA